MGDIITRQLKNGKVAYYARYVELDGKRTSKATKAKTPDAAQKWLERAELRVANGLAGDPRPRRDDTPKAPTLTVRALCEQFCGWTQNKAERFKTGAGAENDDPEHYRRGSWSVLKKHVFPALADREVADVRRVDIVNLKDALTAGKSAWIVSRTLRKLGRVFNWAVEREIVSTNPCAKVKKPKTNGATTLYSNEEVAKLLAWAAENDPLLHPIIAFAYYSGCRKGEIAALRWSDIDWQGKRIVVQRSWKKDARKNGKPVVVTMQPHLQAILTALHERTGGEGKELVFPDPSTKTRRTEPDAPNGWMRDKFDLWGLDVAIEKTKARRFRSPWHSFRHTHATDLAINGAPLTAIRDALGQSTLHMAANYTHLASEHVRQYVDRLPTMGPTAPTVASLDAARAAKAKVDTRGIRKRRTPDKAKAASVIRE